MESAVADAPLVMDANETGTTDAPGDPDASACAALAGDLAKAKARARDCMLASGQCTTTVNDECDCPVIVATAGSAASTDYSNAVAAYLAACKKPATCGTCPQLGATASWACLQPMGVIHCTPPSD